MKNKKVLVIGLDGATWDLIKPWADAGELPTFKKLMEEGAWGTLESTIPPATCPAWPSMLTGKKPDKLGLYYFTKRNPAGYNPVINKRKVTKSIWQLLSKYGQRCYVINVPLSELFEKNNIDNNVFVGDPILNTGEITNQPRIKSLIEEIGYKLELPKYEKGKEKNYLINAIQQSKKQFLLVKKLLKENWNLFFYVIFLTDPISHLYWKYLDPKHPDYQENEQVVKLIKKFYQEIDQFLESILDKTQNLFIVSDHGFGPLLYEINLNEWLTKEGFMKKRKTLSSKLLLIRAHLMAQLIKIGNKSYFKPLAIKLAPFFGSGHGKSIFERAPLIEFIDWRETRAYSIYYGGININLKGREPMGIVQPEDYETVREEIIKKALQIRDPEGTKVVEKAWKVEEIYENPSFTSFPDIVLKFKEYSKYRNRVNINLGLSNKLFVKSLESGGHTLYGIFLAYGPGIKKGYKIEGAKIYDIAPTILHIFGLPIPNDMDGRVLMEIFEEDSEFAKRKPKYVDPVYYEKEEGEKERIKQAIKSLKEKGKI